MRKSCGLFLPLWYSGPIMKRNHIFNLIAWAIVALFGICLISCTEEGKVLSKPDEYTRVFEAKEEVVVRAIARTYKDKGFGDATIDADENRVESGYLIQGDWRTKSMARVKAINWKECEVTLSVITEKKTPDGWEMRRLLEKRQYDTFFDAIDLEIYKDMYKMK